MKYYRTIGVLFVMVFWMVGCYSFGHKDYVNYWNGEIGKKMPYTKPFKYKNSGSLIRGDFAISGQGLISIDTDENGSLVYHFSVQEILPHYHKKEWVGKCLTYVVVEPETHIVKSWGFDKGGNPLSCRTWQ